MSAPTCGGRPLSGLCRTVVSKERNSRLLSEKKSVQRGGADFGSAAGAGKMSAARPSLNALGPRATSGARPTAGKQPEFTSGVKRSRRRASGAGRTAYLAQTGLRVLRDTAKSEIIPPAPPWFCLPASPVRQDRVNGKIMPEAKGEGESACRNAVFQRTGAPGDVRSPADGRQAAGIHFRR